MIKSKLAPAYRFMDQHETQSKPRVGISACLCGDKVRYDGRSKGLPELISALEEQLELQKICPEVAIGMGVPRAPIQLIRNTDKIEARGVENPALNVTGELKDYANSLIKTYSLSNANNPPLCGFIFKARSPSCGVGSTPLYKENSAVDVGSGIVAHQIQHQLPWLPIAEEADLLQPEQLCRFVLLAQLVQLFFNGVINTTSDHELMTFHRTTADIRQELLTTTQAHLDQLAAPSSAGTPFDYLTLLIKALKKRPLLPTR